MNPSGSASSVSRKPRPHSSLSQFSNQPGSTSGISSLAPRPISSASSIRPTSRASYRPKSRQQKINTAKILSFCEDIVRRVIDQPEDENDEIEIKCHELIDWSVKQLGMESLNKAALTMDMEHIECMVRGHVEKSRVKSHDTLAMALERGYGQLKEIAEGEHDLDDEIKKHRLPAHIQFLLAMSSAPQQSTLTYASLYLDALDNPPPSPESDNLTWKKILEEDPYEGDHWIGVPGGIPHPRHRRSSSSYEDNESLDNRDTSPSLSPLNSDDLALDDFESDQDAEASEFPDKIKASVPVATTVNTGHRPVYTTYAYRKELEDLKTKQFWRPDWKMDLEATLQQRGTFDIGDASTLGLTLQRVLPKVAPTEQLPLELVLSANRYIQEQDAVRDVLIALQGRNNIMFDRHFKTTKSTPKLLHFSLASQQSLLDTLGSFCRTIQRLRQFVSSIIRYSSLTHLKTQQTISALDRMRAPRGKITRTLEAFADAIDAEIRALEVWCSEREETWLRALGGVIPSDNPGHVVSLLGTEKAFRDRFEDSFQVLLKVVIEVVGEPQQPPSESESWSLPTRSPSLTTTLLLDILFFTVQQQLEQGNGITAETLMRVFVRSAEPVWGMVGKWVGTGFDTTNGARNNQSSSAGGGLEEEFFIESNDLGIGLGVLGLLDPDFWREGYCLREGSAPEEDDEKSSQKVQTSVPSFLRHVALTVLEAGKAIGLLKALGMDVQSLDNDVLFGQKWVYFQTLLANGPRPKHGGEAETEVAASGFFSVSVDRLSRAIYDKLAPYGQAAGSLLAKVIVEECDFWHHLKAIESLYLMRRGDIISDFADVLFAKMNSRQNWTDFHFLNTAFSDIIDASNSVGNVDEAIQVALFRLSFRGTGLREKTISRTLKALDGLSLEYAVPFPLTYIFTPANLQIYGEIFVFLLQIRRAKSLLEKILVRGKAGNNPGIKAFYVMRSRLSWFINIFFNFITTYVIHTQTLAFHKSLSESQSQSFDQMIINHDDHLKKVQSHCLLQAKTAALYRAISSILDMTLNFSDLFGAFSSDTTMHDISSHPMVLKHHRSRKQRRRRKNVIGFSSYSIGPLGSDSSSDNSDVGDEMDYSYSTSMNASTYAENDDLFTKISKMSTDLDGLIRFVRRGVETLAGGTGDAAATFGVLAFSLEDWDL